jgi:diguanylate cyclase (GGDEF)-like protein
MPVAARPHGLISKRSRRDEAADGEPPRRNRSTAMQLAAEVERLQRQLAEMRAQVAVLETCADVDPLTEVLNRRGFERELARSLAYVKRHGANAALLYLDLDDFKRVNDRYGHAAGDAVLKAIASVLRRHTRESDLVGRLGGDEFAVLLWHCDETHAQTKALALEVAIARATPMHDGTALAVAASVGAGMLLPLDRAAQTLERADRAMYARKAVRCGKASQ